MARVPCRLTQVLRVRTKKLWRTLWVTGLSSCLLVFKNSALPHTKTSVWIQVSATLIVAAKPLCPWIITCWPGCWGALTCWECSSLLLTERGERTPDGWRRFLYAAPSSDLKPLACLHLTRSLFLNLITVAVQSHHRHVLQSRNHYRHHGAQGPYRLILHCHQEVHAGHSPHG